MLNSIRARLAQRLLSVRATPSESERPAWVEELLSAIHKQGRASLKQMSHFEAALAEQATRIDALNALLLAEQQRRAPEREVEARSLAAELAPLFDALDALDEAQRVTQETHLAAGLSRVAERVSSYCERAGFRRVRSLGAAPDPRCLRIVGTETCHGVSPGHVSRVVRAAILQGELLVREGEVIVSARNPDEVHDGHLGN